ncbi:hypothetical protein [Pseudomonas typographi]|uniref:hypothetical protein n=1 Tax=Pseudomonas typographi TaxID=2715964 RepID=UPI0030B89AB5
MTTTVNRSKRFNPSGMLCGLLLGLAASAQGGEFTVGAGTHLLNRTGDVAPAMAMAQQAGIASLRDDAWWSSMELQPGVLHTPAEWRKYLAEQQRLGLGNVLILGYGNQFYNRDAKPIAQTVRNGFARYVDEVTQRLKGQVDYWEIYNEWDIAKPRLAGDADSRAYLKLVHDTAPQVRKNDPKALLLAGAVTTDGIEKGFAERLVQGGVMNMVDGLSLHPYVHCAKAGGGNTPEHWAGWLRDLSQQFDRLAGREVPLYLTEMGWHSTGDRHPCGIASNTQAAFLARSFLLAKTVPAIKGMWWYDLVNDGDDPADPEHNFGLVRQNLSPKPAYAVLKALSPLLRQGVFESQATGADNSYQLLFSLGGEQQLAAWAPGRTRAVTIHAGGPLDGPVRLLDTRHPEAGSVDSDSHWQCQGEQCSAQLALGEFPLLINLGKARWLPPTAAQE